MSASKKTSSDNDVVFNRSLLRYGDEIRNIQSWLAPTLKVKDGTTSADIEEEQEVDVEGDQEEGGLGYAPPTDKLSTDRQSLSSNERLRKQLLGSRGNQNHTTKKFGNHKLDRLTASKPRPKANKVILRDDEDESEGRTSTASRKLNKTAIPQAPVLRPNHELHENLQGPAQVKSKKRSAAYLDEILAQRQTKKKYQKSTKGSKLQND